MSENPVFLRKTGVFRSFSGDNRTLQGGADGCLLGLMKLALHDWMAGGDACFETMALEAFEWQFARNETYRRYCEKLGRTPAKVSSWLEIPAVPTDVFKLEGLAMRCFPEHEVGGHFLTSGTTGERKGRHEYRDLDLYRAAALGGWRSLELPVPERPVFFSQTADDAPHSSLVRMFGFLAEGRDAQWLIDGQGGFGGIEFGGGVRELLGTSLALMRYCELGGKVELAEGSWIFETGGGKGLGREFSAAKVRKILAGHFGVPEGRILNEYGMTELSSQFYKWGDKEVHKGPPWTGIRVVDVESGGLAEPGQAGYLEVIDLANLESVIAVRTQDFAVARGPREFELLGRDPGALPRGCGRGMEAVLR